MHAIYEELLPASGTEFATFLQLTHDAASSHAENSKRSSAPFCDLVTARGNVVNVFNVVKWLDYPQSDGAKVRAAILNGDVLFMKLLRAGLIY